MQDVLIATLAHVQWPAAQMTEARAKTQLALHGQERSFFHKCAPSVGIRSEDELDQLLAGYAAYSFFALLAGWRHLASLEVAISSSRLRDDPMGIMGL